MTRLPGLLVVGTDTGVGKTFVSTALVRRIRKEGKRVGALKPVATGLTTTPGGECLAEDPDQLRRSLGIEVPLERVCPLLFREPVAPPVAARAEGTALQHREILECTQAALSWWEGQAELMIVEGVGGWLCPLAEGTTVADLAIELDYPVLIVARRGLGTLNHTLLTTEAILNRGLRVAGVILNGSEPTTNPLAEATNRAELSSRLGDVPVLAEIPHALSEPALDLLLGSTIWYDRCQASRRRIVSTSMV